MKFWVFSASKNLQCSKNDFDSMAIGLQIHRLPSSSRDIYRKINRNLLSLNPGRIMQKIVWGFSGQEYIILPVHILPIYVLIYISSQKLKDTLLAKCGLDKNIRNKSVTLKIVNYIWELWPINTGRNRDRDRWALWNGVHTFTLLKD